jgi:hypothetical protein
MQSTWDEVFVDLIDKYGERIPHVVEVNEAVFSIVSFSLLSLLLFFYATDCAQVNQRIYEWCALFGSAALTIVNALFNNSEDFNTDDARVTFAKGQLSNLAFLYSKAEGNDKLVCSVPTAVLVYQNANPHEW